jgi:hypothetical protein
MLIVFHSKPAAEVLMFSQHALPLLRAAGKPFTDTLPERGVITHADLPEAIAGIERAISFKQAQEPKECTNQDDALEHPIFQPVSFRQRAFPLLAMLRVSLEHRADVTWEPAPLW